MSHTEGFEWKMQMNSFLDARVVWSQPKPFIEQTWFPNSRHRRLGTRRDLELLFRQNDDCAIQMWYMKRKLLIGVVKL